MAKLVIYPETAKENRKKLHFHSSKQSIYRHISIIWQLIYAKNFQNRFNLSIIISNFATVFEKQVIYYNFLCQTTQS